MSGKRCLYQVVKSDVIGRGVYRSVFTSSTRLQEDKDSKKKESTAKNGFYSRIKDNFIQNLESNEQSRESLEAWRKNSAKLHSKYDEYIGSKLPSFKSENESQESDSTPKIKFSDKVNSIKARFDREKLSEDYINITRTIKEKSETKISQIKSWREKGSSDKETNTETGFTEDVDPAEQIQKKSRFRNLLEKSGVSDNPIFQKAKDQTTTYYAENKEKLSEVYKSSGIRETFQKSKSDLQDEVSQKSKELGKTMEDVSKKLEKTTSGVSEDLQKRTKEFKDKVEEIGQSESFKNVAEATSETIKTAAGEIFDSTKLKESETYKSPEELRKRIDDEAEEDQKDANKENPIKIDEETLGVAEHQGSKWESQWKHFKENNQIVDKVLEYRTKMEESDNVFMRAGYTVLDTVGGIFRGMIEPGEISLTIAEIHKVDPNFSQTEFSTTLRFHIVPNVIEAYLRKDMKILENWCHERAFGQFKQLIAARQHRGTIQLIDIGECDIVTGKKLEQGPVFMFNVQTQQLFSETKQTKTSSGEVLETTTDAIKFVVYTIAVCRDQTMFDPTAAWTILEIIEHVTTESGI